MALLTAAQARLYVPGLSGDDANLATMIDRADSMLAVYCGYPAPDSGSPTMEDTTYTVYLDGPSPTEPRKLALPVRPVQSITTIHDDLSGTWDYGSGDLVASSDYVLDSQTGAVWLRPDAAHGGWGTSPRGIKVVMVAGYATIPSWLQHAAGMLVSHMWQMRHTGGMQATSAAGRSETLRPETIPDQVRLAMAQAYLHEVGLG